MASFVIHNIAGERLLKLLEEYGVELSEDEKDEFLFGNLIVDSSRLKFLKIEGKSLEENKKIFRRLIQEEKKITHFRNEDDSSLCIQVPNLDKFENKYGSLLVGNLSAMGYLFHLYTDRMFFEDLFINILNYLDCQKIILRYTKKLKIV